MRVTHFGPMGRRRLTEKCAPWRGNLVEGSSRSLAGGVVGDTEVASDDDRQLLVLWMNSVSHGAEGN
jgi:hypothetical protein